MALTLYSTFTQLGILSVLVILVIIVFRYVPYDCKEVGGERIGGMIGEVRATVSLKVKVIAEERVRATVRRSAGGDVPFSVSNSFSSRAIFRVRLCIVSIITNYFLDRIIRRLLCPI